MNQQAFADRYLGANGGHVHDSLESFAWWLRGWRTDRNGRCDLASAWDECKNGTHLYYIVSLLGSNTEKALANAAIAATNKAYDIPMTLERTILLSDARNIRKRIKNPWRP
jgi:hypothetical protein